MISCTDHVETFIHSGHLRRVCIWVRTAHVSNTLCAVILTSNVERARARTCRCCHVFCLERETHQYLILITVSFSFLCQLSITFFGLCAFYENDDDNHFFFFIFICINCWVGKIETLRKAYSKRLILSIYNMHYFVSNIHTQQWFVNGPSECTLDLSDASRALIFPHCLILLCDVILTVCAKTISLSNCNDWRCCLSLNASMAFEYLHVCRRRRKQKRFGCAKMLTRTSQTSVWRVPMMGKITARTRTMPARWRQKRQY